MVGLEVGVIEPFHTMNRSKRREETLDVVADRAEGCIGRHDPAGYVDLEVQSGKELCAFNASLFASTHKCKQCVKLAQRVWSLHIYEDVSGTLAESELVDHIAKFSR